MVQLTTGEPADGTRSHDGLGAKPRAGSFTQIATRLLATFADTRRVLDVGCAKGLLVQAFTEAGVDATGIDVSRAAISDADESVRARLSVGSATEPVGGPYDLITCLEVLEHLDSADAEAALDQLCAATDVIVFSSTPIDFAEPTLVDVKPVAEWMAAFALRGFFRRTDLDLSYLSPWAVVVQRGTPSARDLVHHYESLLAPLREELQAKRVALLNTQEAMSAQAEPEVVAALRHEVLRLRDHAIGAEAAVGTAQAAAAATKRELEDLRNSETFRLGQAAAKPVRAMKSGVRKVLHG